MHLLYPTQYLLVDLCLISARLSQLLKQREQTDTHAKKTRFGRSVGRFVGSFVWLPGWSPRHTPCPGFLADFFYYYYYHHIFFLFFILFSCICFMLFDFFAYSHTTSCVRLFFLLDSRLLCYLFRVFRKFSFRFDFLNTIRSFYEFQYLCSVCTLCTRTVFG